MVKTGRNDPCPCGSGIKYKKCCMQKDAFTQIVTVPPILLEDVRINGITMENTLAGEVAPVLVRASITSDLPEFYSYMKGMNNLLTDRARKAGVELMLNQVSNFLLVTHVDGTADLHVQNVPIALEILAKHDLAGGEIVYQSSIADIIRVRFPGVELNSTDGVIFCFKVGWKFGLFFDLAPDRELDVDAMERSLGNLYRLLSYEEVYAALGDQNVFSQIVKSGWFPFIEIIGGEFEQLLAANKASFNFDKEEQLLLQKFDDIRINEIRQRWSKRLCLRSRLRILEPALEAFKRGDPVSCLKIILTEIEGIIRDVHIADLGAGAKIEKLLKYATDQGVKKTGNEASLLFPKQFLEFLSDFTFKRFDPKKPQAGILSRHSVGHGGATAESYTQIRALQAILTLDQLSFYL